MEKLKQIELYTGKINPHAIHVYGDCNKWKIRRHGCKKARNVCETKKTALEKATEIMKKYDICIFVHKPDATIEKVITRYGEF